jgi:hypothetical protein
VDSFDHVMFGDGAIQSGYYEAISGYNGESAGDRVGRLCDEEGLVHDVAAGDTELMGPQLPGDILSLLRECEDSDEAVLVERRTGEIGFDPHVTRLNLAVTMTLDYETVADMVVDDSVRDATNRATVSRIGGSSGTHERTDGARGSNPATGIGVYPATPQRSLNADDIAVQHASWIVNIGTVDEPRYVITVDLHHTPELVTQWLGCDIGSRILVTGPPAIRTGPAPLDLILEGYDEVLDATSWLIVLYLEPYRPYEVLEIGNGGDNRSRIAAGVSTTDAAYSASATSLSVTSASVRWIDSATYSSRFPITIVIAGEVMTCTAITGTGLTQTFTVTRGLHGVAKTLPIGSAVQVWRAAAIAL